MTKLGYFIDDHFGWFLSLFIVVALGLFILGIRQLSHHYDTTACNRFGEESNREVRLVDYSFWQWDCLTPSSDGKWIPTEQLRDIDS